MRGLLHHRLDRPPTQTPVEVWADDPQGAAPGGAPAVVLWFDDEVSSVDLSPTEARALAALLILAAERQERTNRQ